MAAIRIEPDRVYSEFELRAEGTFSDELLKYARRTGLRFLQHRQGRRLYRGAWLLQWMEENAQQAAAEGGAA